MPNGDFGGLFDLGSLIGGLLQTLVDFITAVLQFLNALVSAIVQALDFLYTGEQNVYGFSFSSLGEVWQGFKKLMDTIFKNIILATLTKLYNLYQKLAAWARKLQAWLDKLHALMRKYQMMYFRRIIQIIQRARKILTIFRFFHLKFAQKLDNWLATIEGKIAHYLILVAQKENEVIAWVNFIVDPLGHLKTLPFLAGLIAALDVTWAGIFGTPFTQWFSGTLHRGPSARVSTSIGVTVSDVKTGAGDAGKIAGSWQNTQRQFVAEVGGA
ncbi:MAG: hypothetical protein HRJ53_07460 [Acidobacteria bacterium Pan2503]|uniref:Uncharacterized protein n=1 Tax=Candidatus Acidiferrum panamense TaxID=2741543 RepID=A0A7V8NNW0_9BACT|nr:hypothetical protein [Candidatus Acidoferrum panamensis]